VRAVEPSAQLFKWGATIWDHGSKRAFDIIDSLVGLIALSLVLVGIALAIRRLSGRPVFFRQMRSGLNGRPFELVKAAGVCYEAGPCGYGVHRQLTSLGHWCDVVAPRRRATG
jgi:lipopolysaccharide/colanic/teichoic acid biosynthesis glycosyltransferase